ncbi:hypothetical protein Tco_0851828, partial [Tanacetum coccineum]
TNQPAALDRDERRDEKEEIESLETRLNNVSDQEIENGAVFVGRKTQRSLLAVSAVPDISGGCRRLTLPFLSFSEKG